MDNQKTHQLINDCPLCGALYESKNIQTVSQGPNGALLYFKCASCASGLVASIVEAPFGLLGSGLVTDLAFDEVSRFLASRALTDDDVIAFHRLFRNASPHRRWSHNKH